MDLATTGIAGDSPDLGMTCHNFNGKEENGIKGLEIVLDLAHVSCPGSRVLSNQQTTK